LAQSKYQQAGVALRAPIDTDGAALHELVAACPPLDENSRYCNLLQCGHFAGTSVVAQWQASGQLAGAITGYRLPDDPSVLFVWQVAVHPDARGLGLGRAMLEHLVERCGPDGVTSMQTTITEDNEASWAMFRSLARHAGAEFQHDLGFCRDRHFAGQHDSEFLVRIGPFNAVSGAIRGRDESYQKGAIA